MGCARRLAAAMPDRRDASRIEHEMFEMVMARVAAIACGHEDAIDLDRLRHDPLMKIAVGRCPTSGAPLASQSTISRLENAPSKTQAARLAAALIDQAGTTVRPGKQAVLDIDDTFCAAHGGQQLAFWNAHHDERGFASMHIYHVASGTPVATILRPARTPKRHGGVHRHQACDQAPAPTLAEDPHRLARRQPLRPRRGDGMGGKQRYRLHFWPCRQCRARRPGGRDRHQSALPSCDEQQAEAAHLCELHVPGRQLEAAAQSRGPARVLAAAGRRRDRHAPGGRHPLRRHLAQGLGAAPLRERLLPARADGEPDQAAQGAVGVGSHVVSQRDRQSGAARSPHRRVLADAWRARRDPADQPARQGRVRDDPRASDQDRCARDRAHRAHPHPAADQLPGAGVVPDRRARPDAVRPMSRGAACPDEPPTKADQPHTRCTASCLTPIPPDGSPVHASPPDVQK